MFDPLLTLLIVCLLYGSKPDNTNLKAFGCVAFISTIKQGRNKFSPRSNPSIFIGYPYGQKAYKLYDLVTHKVVISRDVIFYEKHFPYHFDKNIRMNKFFIPVETPSYDAPCDSRVITNNVENTTILLNQCDNDFTYSKESNARYFQTISILA